MYHSLVPSRTRTTPAHTFRVAGQTVPALANATFALLQHAHNTVECTTPSWAPNIPDSITYSPVLLIDFLEQLTFVLRPVGASGVTVGEGVRRSVLRELVIKTVQDERYFLPQDPANPRSYYVPVFDPMCPTSNPSSLSFWKAAGSSCRLAFIHLRIGPAPMSPLFLAAIQVGKVAFHNFTLPVIMGLDSSRGSVIACWFRANPQPEDLLPTDLMDPLVQVIAIYLDLQVRLTHLFSASC